MVFMGTTLFLSVARVAAILGVQQRRSWSWFVSVRERCTLYVAAVGGVALVRQQGRPAACLQSTTRWVVGEGGSHRSPERWLRMVGATAPFRRVSWRGARVSPRLFGQRGGSLWRRSSPGVVFGTTPLSFDRRMHLFLVGHGGWTWVMVAMSQAKASPDGVGASDSDAFVRRSPPWRWPPSPLGGESRKKVNLCYFVQLPIKCVLFYLIKKKVCY